MSGPVLEAHAALVAAQRAFEATLRREYPAGAAVSWRRHNRTFAGTVVQHGFGVRLEVRNAQSGRTAWIHASAIVETLKQAEKAA